jgi:hypothetical protein
MRTGERIVAGLYGVLVIALALAGVASTVDHTPAIVPVLLFFVVVGGVFWLVDRLDL